MVDKEVVDILAEIKHRVSSAKSSESPTRPSTNGTSSTATELPADLNHDYASLSVLARAWDRLPPLVTNRTGTVAKIDLWIKAKMKTAFRWFTWEQVNFNAATHQTLKELIETLGTYEQQLKSYVQQLQHTNQKLDDEVGELHRQLDSVRQENEQFRTTLSTQLSVLRALQAELDSKLERYSTYLNETKTSVARENEARLEEVLREIREKHEQILDEHRVSFKQLSLQLTEAQVLQDRARRKLDDRVAKLES